MDIHCNKESLEALIDIFTDLDRLPLEYSRLLQPLFDEVKKNEILSIAALKRCKRILERWDDQDGVGVPEEVVKRSMDLWLTIKGEDYPLRKSLSDPPNLVVQEVEASDFIDERDPTRIEFDSTTGEPIRNALGNLIIEQVEATDYVELSDSNE